MSVCLRAVLTASLSFIIATDCVGDFVLTGDCSNTCGAGTQTLTYQVVSLRDGITTIACVVLVSSKRVATPVGDCQAVRIALSHYAVLPMLSTTLCRPLQHKMAAGLAHLIQVTPTVPSALALTIVQRARPATALRVSTKTKAQHASG